MNFNHKEIKQFQIIETTGRLDVTHAPLFEKEVQKYIDDGHKKLIIDMNGVDYISSAGLRSILISAKAIKKIQGEIRFCDLTEIVEEVFTISGFKSMFKIFDSVTAATDD